MWIPQSGMALGIIVLAIALIDDFVTVLRGGPASFERNSDVLATETEGGKPGTQED